jgi:hypothetical protein
VEGQSLLDFRAHVLEMCPAVERADMTATQTLEELRADPARRSYVALWFRRAGNAIKLYN